MKVNQNFLQKLKEKNINVDLAKYQQQLRTAKGNPQKQASGSDVDSMESSFLHKTDDGNQESNSHFRVRPINHKKEDKSENQNAVMGMNQMSYSMMDNSQVRKQKSKVNAPEYQQLIDMRLNPPKSSQSTRTTSSSTMKTSDNVQMQQSSANRAMNRTMTSTFYGDVSAKNDPFSKPPLTRGNSETRLCSADTRRPMTVSIYKDDNQNKLRQELLQFTDGGENDNDGQFSDFVQGSHNSYNDLSQDMSDGDGIYKNSEINEQEDKEETYKNGMDKPEQMMNSSGSKEDIEKKEQGDFDDFLEKYEQEDGDGENWFEEQQLIQDVQQQFISETITPQLIEKITDSKEEEFERIRKIALRHDCEQDSLQGLGEYLPNLNELNINDSIANSLRDIGTSMQNLKVLWISRVRLQDFSGINAFPLLVELYASYNQIVNLNDLYFHNNLEVLDLEGNDISSLDTIEVLESLPKLKILNLYLNPISKTENYRANVLAKVTQLQLLDDIDVTKNPIPLAPRNMRRRMLSKRSGQMSPGEEEEEEEDLYEALKKLEWNGDKFLSEEVVQQLDQELKQELNEFDLLIYSVKKTSNKSNKKFTQNLPDQTLSLPKNSSNIFNTTGLNFNATSSNFNATSSNFRRPPTANSSNPFSLQKNPFPDSMSSLLEGTDQAFCGNPLKALKHKRKNDLVTTNKHENGKVEGSACSFDISIPKNIVNLLDQFRHETSNDEITRLKDDLKVYDFMVDQQKYIPRRRPVTLTETPPVPGESGDTEIKKSKILIKRPVLKIRAPSQSCASTSISNGAPDLQKNNIQQQIKVIKAKTRIPIRPNVLLQQQARENPIIN